MKNLALIILFIPLLAFSATPLETKYNFFANRLNKQTREIYSLRDSVIILNRRKKGNNKSIKNKNLVLNNKIVTIKRDIKQSRDSVKYYRKKLIVHYNNQLDSLRKKKGFKSNDSLSSKYLSILQKKIKLNYSHFSPYINWKKIQTLSITNPDDSLENIFFKDMLDRTEAKIDSNLTIINNNIKDIQQYQKLLKKKEIFIDELNDGPLLTFNYEEKTEEKNTGNYGENERETVKSIQGEFSFIQSDLFLFSEKSFTDKNPDNKKSIDQEKYYDFLKDMAKLLQYYKKQISQKRKSMR